MLNWRHVELGSAVLAVKRLEAEQDILIGVEAAAMQTVAALRASVAAQVRRLLAAQ